MPTATGIWPPAATPFREDLSIDTERYIAFCHELLRDGAHGLAVLGTTSEANSLDLEERKQTLEKLVASGINPAQLLPGTGAASFGDAVKLTRHAAELGVKGSLLLPPFYYKGVSDEGLYAWFSQFFEKLGSAARNVVVYHIPSVTAVDISVGLVQRHAGDDCRGQAARIVHLLQPARLAEAIAAAGIDMNRAAQAVAGGVGEEILEEVLARDGSHITGDRGGERRPLQPRIGEPRRVPEMVVRVDDLSHVRSSPLSPAGDPVTTFNAPRTTMESRDTGRARRSRCCHTS